MSHHCGRFEKFTDRRDFLKKAGAGFGLLALADLLRSDYLLAADVESSLNSQPSTLNSPMAPRQPHYPAKAKSIIWLFMEGAPSSVDLFDPKPELTKRDGQRINIDVFNGNPGPPMKSPFGFQQHGQSGAWVCEKYPNVAKHEGEPDLLARIQSFELAHHMQMEASDLTDFSSESKETLA